MVRSRRVGGAVLGVGLALGALGACGGTPAVTVGAPASTVPAIRPILPEPDAEIAAGAESEPDRPYVVSADGVLLPDPRRTPGAVFEDVETADVCAPYYTQGVRQPRFNAKVQAFSAYGVSIHDRDLYRVDHLVPIALGGSNEVTNLWPQPYDLTGRAEQKDALEGLLRDRVCAGEMTIEDARSKLATDWWSQYQTYFGAQEALEGSDDGGSNGPASTVVNGGPCPIKGAVGYTVPKGIALTCTLSGSGALVWQKRG